MTNPLVTVIIPLYNHSNFIESALLSVFNQTYRPIQLIVIDDGSTDDGALIAENLMRRAMPEAVLIRRTNSGAHNALNFGLQLASGDYIAILNSDDSFHVERLARCVDTALRTGREFVFTSVSFIDESGNATEDDYVCSLRLTEQLSQRYPTLGYALMKNNIAISTGNFFFSRNIAVKLTGFRHYRYVHDWDFILRALFHTEPYFIREPLYNYRLHGDNSFRSLGAIAGYETTEVMRNFLWLVHSRLPENDICPCPHYWPGFFDWFIHTFSYEHYLPTRDNAI